MLPNTQPEGNTQQPAGGAEQPTSTPSGSESQPLPDYVVALQSQIASLQAEIKGQQKGADKRFGQMQGDIKRILELKDQGLNETQIQRELWIDSQIAQPREQNSPVQPIAGSEQPNTSLDVDAIVKSLKFPDNDIAFAKLKQQYANNPQGLIAAAAALRVEQLQTSTPTPATALSQTNGNAGIGLTEDQITDKALELEGLYKNYTKNRPAIEELEKELETAGVLRRREA